MRSIGLFGLTTAVMAAMAAELSNAGGGPPVLRKLEPDDSVVFRLPAPIPVKQPVKKVVPVPPVVTQSSLPGTLDLRLPPLPELPPRPAAIESKPPEPALPGAMRNEVAF